MIIELFVALVWSIVTLEAGFVSSELAQSMIMALILLRLEVQTLGPCTPHMKIHHAPWYRLCMQSHLLEA